MSQQSLRQASIRAVTSTTYTYEGDWHALWDLLGIAAGTFNERMLLYINNQLSTSYTELNGAMAAFAAEHGSTTFQAIGTFTPGFSLTAPVLAFVSATDPDSDNTQDLLAEVSADIGDNVIRLVGTFGSATVSEPYDIDSDEGDPDDDLDIPFTTGAIDDGVCSFKCRVEDGSGNALSDWSNTVSKTIDATAPTITSSNAINQAENAAFSHTLTANESVTWTKTGGADTALFTLAGSNLSMTAKDYEAPADADTNNTYVVQVTATDTAGNATNQTITVTVTDVAESTTWNSADKNAGMSLSNGDLTVTGSSLSGYSSIRSIASAASGKKYWETVISTLIGFAGPGFGNSTASLSNYAGQSVNGVSWFLNGTVFQNGGGIGSIQTFAQGDVLCVALDLDNNKVWFRTNGGNWNNSGTADPATNTGGITFTSVGTAFAMMTQQVTGDIGTSNFGGSAYAQTPPSGFGNWA